MIVFSDWRETSRREVKLGEGIGGRQGADSEANRRAQPDDPGPQERAQPKPPGSNMTLKNST